MKQQDKKKSYETRQASYLLNRFGLLFLLGCLVLAVWNGQVVLALLFSLVISTAGLARIWGHLALKGVSFDLRLNGSRAFPGEDVNLELKLVNRKPLPLPWVQLDVEVPAGIVPDGSHVPGNAPGSGILSKSMTLLWYSAAKWRHSLHCEKRGYYNLGPASVSSGDIFGLYQRSSRINLDNYVIVYPKVYPITQLGIPPLYLVGETVASRRIFEDPTRIAGTRDYTPNDSRRYIHWKASAHSQKLQVKVLDPTVTLNIALFLAVDTFQEQDDGYDMELGISTAASIACYLVERRSGVGMYVNSCLAGSNTPCEILPGSSPVQLVQVLEALARVTTKTSKPFGDFLDGAQAGLPLGTTLVFVLSSCQQALVDQLSDLKERGFRMMVLQIGRDEKNIADHFPGWCQVTKPGDLVSAGLRESR